MTLLQRSQLAVGLDHHLWIPCGARQRQDLAIQMRSAVTGISRKYKVDSRGSAYSQRLMARGVAVRWYQHEYAVAKYVVRAVDETVVERLVPIRRVVWTLRCASHVHLGALHDEGRAREECVAATMIEVEVRIDDVRYIVGLQTHGRQLVNHILILSGPQREDAGNALAQARDWIQVSIAIDAGIKEHRSAIVPN